MRKIYILLSLLSPPTLAQSLYGVQGGISYFGGSERQNPHPSTWSNGIAISALAEFHVWDALSIRASGEFSFYRFEEYQFRGPTPGIGSISSSIGEDSQSYSLLVECKLQSSTPQILQLQFLTGLAVVSDQFGEVFTTEQNFLTNQISVRKQPNNSSRYFAQTFAGGFQSFLFPRVGLDFVARVYTDYSVRLNSSLNLGIVYRLE